MKYRNVFACASYFATTLMSNRVPSILRGKRFFDVTASLFELPPCGVDIVMNE